MNAKILVASHKNYEMPTDSIYVPVFVGKDLHPNVNNNFRGDNTGINISLKNSTYNELTALYWGWKNLNVDALGLVHYRRYLSLNHKKSLSSVLNTDEVNSLLESTDVILPSKRHYYIESNESHYLHAHEHQPFENLRFIIFKKYPEYGPSFERVMKRTWAHMFNMFIMKKTPLNEYCIWLFKVLSDVEQMTDISGYSKYEQRVYGFLSELLLDVWLDYHSEYQTQEVNYVFMEHTNWFKKGGKFLIRKMKGHS